MNQRSAQFICAMLLLVGEAVAALSSWDEMQMGLLELHPTPLRWDNIEGKPHWVAGPKPDYSFRKGLHLIRLHPGDQLTLHAPADSWLRLAGDGKTLRPEDIIISVSTDTRLFAEVRPVTTVDPYSLLISLPGERPSLVRLKLPGHASSDCVFAAWFSRREYWPTLAPFRASVHLPDKTVRLSREGENGFRRARLLAAGESIPLAVSGPTRLELEVLIPWLASETTRQKSTIIQVALGGAEPIPLLLESGLDTRNRTRVNGLLTPVSQRAHGFVNIPPGKHRVRLQATAPVYLTVFGQDVPDFLFPQLNGPAAALLDRQLPTLAPDARLIAHPASVFVDPPLSGNPATLAIYEQDAQRLARDNQHLDSGAQAADWLRRLSQTRPEYEAARQAADLLWHAHTLYREVLPSSLSAAERLDKALFPVDRIQTDTSAGPQMLRCEATLEEVCGLLAEAHFAPVPPGLASGLLYMLPDRSHDSRLRITGVTEATHATTLLVQFDEEEPVRLVLDSTNALPRVALEPSEALATLKTLEEQARSSNHPASGPPFGRFDLPLPLVQPGVVELALSQNVRRVRIRLPDATSEVRVSLAFRAAKPFDLGETGYAALLSQVDASEVLRLLARPVNSLATSNLPLVLEQLRNQLVPLSRLLDAHVSQFARGVDRDQQAPKNNTSLSPEAIAGLQATATTLETKGQFIEALEVRNLLFWQGPVRIQSDASLSIIRNLVALGEDYLAGQYARRALIWHPESSTGSAPIPAEAVAVLERQALLNEDLDHLEEVRAFLFNRCPCPTHLASLTETLAMNGREEFALSAGLLLPPDYRPKEILLAAALHLNRWQTFDQLLKALPDAESLAFWRAQRSLAFYRFDEAEKELRQSAGLGREMLLALNAGARIREQLNAPTVRERLEAILAWEQWQSQQVGPVTWRLATDVVQECSGTELAYNSEQNQFAGYLRSECGKPVKLRFAGPLRLQVEARPIFSRPAEKPIDDWLEVVEYGITNRFPILQCVPNPNLRFTTDRNALAGLRTLATLHYGPGWHEVEVSLAGHEGLMRVWQEEALLPLRILPTLNAERLNYLLSAAEISTAGLTPSQRLRLALRRNSSPGVQPATDLQALNELPISEQWLATCRWNRTSDFTNWSALPDSMRAAAFLAVGRVEDLLERDEPRDPLRRLAALLEIAEYYPAWRERAQCLAESLIEPTNCPPVSRKILTRIGYDRVWEALPITPTSAGLKPIQVTSDQPQEPSLRLRRALLPPSDTNQFTLSSRSVLTTALTLQNPARIEVRAEILGVGFSPLAPLTVSMQVDANERRLLVLNANNPEVRTNFNLTAGSHAVRLRIEDPVINQLVRVRLSAQAEANASETGFRSLDALAAERRFFLIATPSQPVRFVWTGPAVLRIDEFSEGTFSSQIRFVPAGQQAVELPPAPGRDESCYQVFVRSTETNQPRIRMVFNPREPDEVQPPKLRLPEDKHFSRAQLNDYYSPGGQEDGTWTPGLLLAHRRPFEIAEARDTVENEFAEVSLAYRKANSQETLWFKTEGLARVHKPGDVTLGLSEQIEGRPRTLPFEWSWSGEAYVGTTGPDREEIDGAMYTQLEIRRRVHLNRKVDWVPFASLFAHYLSLDAQSAGQFDYVDQDLYTLFRDEHRWGGILGSRIEYRPWLDTCLKASLALKSNEDFSLDDWGARFSWAQMLGPFRGEMAYQFQSFLEDSDRSSAAFRQGVSAGLYFEHWFSGRHRLEIGIQGRHDWPDPGNSGFLTLRWDIGNGRAYRDYSPDEMTFRDLRSRRIPGAYNNRLEPSISDNGRQ